MKVFVQYRVSLNQVRHRKAGTEDSMRKKTFSFFFFHARKRDRSLKDPNSFMKRDAFQIQRH